MIKCGYLLLHALFKRQKKRTTTQPTYVTTHTMSSVPPPSDFLCAISLEIMKDPVIAADGHSYERANIERWFQHHNTSPKTGAQLSSTALIPNHTLKSVIEEWVQKQQNENGDDAMVDITPSPPASFAFKSSIAVGAPGADGQQFVCIQSVPTQAVDDTSDISRRSVLFVVDTSASMKLIARLRTTERESEAEQVLSRLDLALHCIKLYLHTCTDADYFGVVTFSTHTKVVVPLQRMADDAKRTALSAINRIRPDSMTNTRAALHTAFEQANTLPDVDVDVVLLTDGDSTYPQGQAVPRNGWAASITDLQQASNNKNVRLHTISFGNEVKVADVTTIAHAGNGTYWHIPDASQLNVFQAIAAMLRTECTRDVPRLHVNAQTELALAPFRYDCTTYTSFYMPQKPDGTQHTAGELATQLRMVCTPLHSDQETTMTEFEPVNGAAAEAMLAVAQAREAVQTLLGKCTSSTTSLDEKRATVRDTTTTLRELSRGSASAIVDKLLEDVTGEYMLAVTPNAWKKWGECHLWFERFAHEHQVVNTTRAIGTQALYGGAMHDQILTKLEDLFATLPPPTPCCPPRVQTAYRGGSTYSGCQAAAAPPPAPVNMRSYQGGGCFHPECHTVTANGNPLRIADLRAGDVLRAFDADGKLCTGTVETVVTFAALCGQPMALTTLPSGWRGTPWHPVYHNDKWVFPHTVAGATTGMSYTADRVISVVFARDPVTGQRATSLLVEGCRSVALAHGLTADAVASHAFYGTEAVVHALQPFAGYAQGHVTIRMGGVERDRCTGLVCGFNVAYEVDDVILTERRETNARAAASAAMLSSRVGLVAAL